MRKKKKPTKLNEINWKFSFFFFFVGEISSLFDIISSLHAFQHFSLFDKSEQENEISAFNRTYISFYDKLIPLNSIHFLWKNPHIEVLINCLIFRLLSNIYDQNLTTNRL